MVSFYVSPQVPTSISEQDYYIWAFFLAKGYSRAAQCLPWASLGSSPAPRHPAPPKQSPYHSTPTCLSAYQPPLDHIWVVSWQQLSGELYARMKSCSSTLAPPLAVAPPLDLIFVNAIPLLLQGWPGFGSSIRRELHCEYYPSHTTPSTRKIYIILHINIRCYKPSKHT